LYRSFFLRILVVYRLRFLIPQIPLLMFDQFILIILHGIDSLLSSTPEASFSSTAPPTLYKIVVLPLHQSIRIRKSIKLLDYSYSSLFTSFLASIHCVSKLSFYKEEFLILFNSKLWIKKFLLCIRQILRIWFLYLPVRVLLVVIGFIRSRLILMNLLSDTKIRWLQKNTFNCMVWIMRRYLPLLQK